MQPFVPRTYKETLFAADDPSRNPVRVTRGNRNRRYAQLRGGITEFPTLVPVTPTPGGASSSSAQGWSPASTTGALPRLTERRGEEVKKGSDDGWGGSTTSKYKLPGPQSRPTASNIDDGWKYDTPAAVPTAPRFNRQYPDNVNQILSSNRKWGSTSASVPYTPAYEANHPATASNIPHYPAPIPLRTVTIPATPSLPPRSILSHPAQSGTPFRTPRPSRRDREASVITANRLIQTHLGLKKGFNSRDLFPPPSIASATPASSHFFTPAPRTQRTSPVDYTPAPRRQTPATLHGEPYRPTQRSPDVARMAPSRSPSPSPPSKHQSASKINSIRKPGSSAKPSPTQILDKLFSKSLSTPPAVPLAGSPPAATPVASPPKKGPPHDQKTLRTEHGPPKQEASPSVPSSNPASFPSLAALTPTGPGPNSPVDPKQVPPFVIDTNSTPRPIIPSNNLEEHPIDIPDFGPVTPDMRDRTEFDGVLGRIRGARTQLLDPDVAATPAVSRGRDESIRREGSRAGHTSSRRSNHHHDERDSVAVDLLRKENKEYQHDIKKMQFEIESLLSDLTTKGNPSINQETTIRRLNRSLKEKDEALLLAEQALEAATTAETPSRSRYRSATPSPTRPFLDHGATRRADELSEKVVTLKASVHDLQTSLKLMTTQYNEEVIKRKQAQETANGARVHASQMAKERNIQEQRATQLEGQVDQERRMRMAANSKVRELEVGQHSNVSMRQEVVVLRNKLASAQQDIVNANEKFRDMAKKKGDFEDKVKDIRRQGDVIHERNEQLNAQLKDQEQLIKVQTRLKEDKREAVASLDRLRLQRKSLREDLTEARNETVRLRRELEINQAAVVSIHDQRSEEPQKVHLQTLASEITRSQASLRSYRGASPSAETSDTVSESGTETLTARVRSRRASCPPTPTAKTQANLTRAHEAYIERRFKLQTPLHPDRSDSESEDVPEADAEIEDQETTPVKSGRSYLQKVANESILVDVPLDADPFGPQDPIAPVPSYQSSQRSKSSDDKTPVAIPREASIGLDTPPAIPVVAIGDPAQVGIDGDSAGQDDKDASVERRQAKEKREVLDYVNDVFNEDMISDLNNTPRARERSRDKRSYKEDLEYLYYDPFAGIDEEFGVSSEQESKREHQVAEGDIEIQSDFCRTPSVADSGDDVGEGDITDSEFDDGSEAGGMD